MLTIHHLSKSYGLNPVLKKISFSLNRSERAALVGPNGCGKSTLLNIIAGEESAESGRVVYTPSDLRIGYLHQGIVFNPDKTLGGYLNQFASTLKETLAGLEELCQALSESPDDPVLVSRYESTLADLAHAQAMEGQRKDILAGFELVELPQDTPIATLSGGQKVRLALAGVLLQGPQVLLLDEPTNHLDIDMRRWLRDWILSYRGEILLVSHDRAFLDAVIHKVIAFPPSGDGVREYPGNYSSYLDEREAEFDSAMQDYADQQVEIKRLKKAARGVRDLARPHKNGKADGKNTDGYSVGFFADRSLETVRRAKQLEKRIEFLESEGKIDKPSHAWDLRMHFTETPDSGKIVLQMDRLEIGYNNIALLPPITQTVTQGQRIALVGPNGSGKTTLFKTLLKQIPPIKGSFSFGSGIQAGYLSQEQELLAPTLTVLETIQQVPGMYNHTNARTFLHRFLFKGDQVFQLVESLSYGQRSRLMLALLVAQHCNLLLLDEPLNHLDLPSREAFEAALSNYEGTILATAHDQHFIERFAQVIWRLSSEGTQSKITKAMLSQILPT